MSTLWGQCSPNKQATKTMQGFHKNWQGWSNNSMGNFIKHTNNVKKTLG